ncbi:MAG: hypothetical protein EOP48_10910 [Sphingobacteriales bacterium]|nr:MAG: hypothetical protein EOP48_10910 [Sphingobacteriales bacterium]
MMSDVHEHAKQPPNRQELAYFAISLSELRNKLLSQRHSQHFSKKFMHQFLRILFQKAGYYDGWYMVDYAVYNMQQFTAVLWNYMQHSHGQIPFFALYYIEDHWIALVVVRDSNGLKAFVVDSDQVHDKQIYMEIQEILQNVGIVQFHIHNYPGASAAHTPTQQQTSSPSKSSQNSGDKQYTITLALANLVSLGELVLSQVGKQKQAINGDVISRMAFSRQADVPR